MWPLLLLLLLFQPPMEGTPSIPQANDVKTSVDVRVPVVVKDVNYEEFEKEINTIVRDIIENNKEFSTTENLVGWREGEQIWIERREMEERRESLEELMRKAEEKGIKEVKKRWKAGKLYVIEAIPYEDASIGREIVIGEKDIEVNMVIVAKKEGVFYIEENLPKGEIDFNQFHAVLNFDPLVVWVVYLEENESARVNYRITSDLRPELEPAVTRLEGCDVKILFGPINKVGTDLHGEFYILLGDSPVYTPDVNVNGVVTFVAKEMKYLFTSENPLILEGRVGDCPFYVRKNVEDYTLLYALLILAVLVVLFIHFSRVV